MVESDLEATTEAPAGPARARGAARIAAALRRAIAEGTYATGERLPAERELAGHFAASRTTVRAAIGRLADDGLVSRRVGSGTYVVGARARDDDVAETTSPLELIEVRLAVEPHMTRLAVLNATARDLAAMAQALSELEAAGGNAEHFSRWDARFHLALAECTHNPLMVAMYRQINRVREHAQWAAMKDTILTPARIAEYNRQHRALYGALVSRDVDGAQRLIATHLDKARRDLLGAAAS